MQLNDNTQVYIRTGNRNNFEILAKIDQIFWLKDHRAKSENLREYLIEEADSRFKKVREINLNRYINEHPTTQILTPECWLKLILVPIYPNDFICTPPFIKDNLEKIFVKEYYGTSEEFPITDTRFNNIISKDSLILKLIFDTYTYYSELNVFGLYYYRQSLLEAFNRREQIPKKIIRFNEILARLDEFIESAIRFYNLIGYQGNLKFSFSILDPTEYELKSFYEHTFFTYEEKIEYKSDISLQSLINDKIDLIFESVIKLTWAYNIHIDKNYLINYYQKNRR